MGKETQGRRTVLFFVENASGSSEQFAMEINTTILLFQEIHLQVVDFFFIAMLVTKECAKTL